MTEAVGEKLRNAVKALSPAVESRALSQSKRHYTDLELWHELMSCILSSQVPFELADAASRRIIQAGIFCHQRDLDERILQRELLRLLRMPLTIGTSKRRYRFPVVKAHQISRAFVMIHCSESSLCERLARSEARALRSDLVTQIPGLGPKQASMFLRNVEFTSDLAIIDSHVINFMRLTGLLSPSTKFPTSMKSYEAIENQLVGFCRKIGHAVGYVDRAIWVVMRVARREAMV